MSPSKSLISSCWVTNRFSTTDSCRISFYSSFVLIRPQKQWVNNLFVRYCRVRSSHSEITWCIMIIFTLCRKFHPTDNINIKILNAGAWSRSSERVPVSLPLELEDFIPEVEDFYRNKHSGRKLQWHHLMSNGIVSCLNSCGLTTNIDRRSHSLRHLYPGTGSNWGIWVLPTIIISVIHQVGVYCMSEREDKHVWKSWTHFVCIFFCMCGRQRP